MSKQPSKASQPSAQQQLAARMANDPAEFRRHLLIDADGQPTPFRPDPWQDADFRAMDPAWIYVAGRSKQRPKVMYSWSERPRGHSKTSDLAISICWALLFAVRPIKGIAAAGDQDQSKLLLSAIETLARLNPWGELLEVQANRVVNKKTGSELICITSDYATSFGHLVDFVATDEVSNWPEEKGSKLWQSLFSAVGKRATCCLCCILNAGFTEGFAHKIRDAVRTDPGWNFSHLDGPQASWLPPERLLAQRLLLPPQVYARLWDNIWSTGSGDLLTEQDIQQAIAAVPAPGPMVYYLGIDLGLTRDKATMAAVGIDQQNHAHLVDLKVWAPSFIASMMGRKQVDLNAVEADIRAAYRERSPYLILADVWQAQQMIQALAAEGLPIEGINFGTAVLTEMASVLLERTSDRTLHLPNDPALLQELRAARLLDRGTSVRVDVPRSGAGHGDRLTALLLALLAARRDGSRPCEIGTAPAPSAEGLLVRVARRHQMFNDQSDIHDRSDPRQLEAANGGREIASCNPFADREAWGRWDADQ